MAQSKGLTKKHSPLQMAHYKAYRLENRALKNLIRRLKTRIRRNEAKDRRRGNRVKRDTIHNKKWMPAVRPDLGAIKALKKLGVKHQLDHLV